MLSEGSAAQAIIASTAIPGAFAPVRYKDFYLADGAISSNTPVRVAVQKGARRLIILPTGYACATHTPPSRRGRQCAACADAPDRAATGQRAGRARPLESNTSWCRHYARWRDRPTISREPPIISSAPSTAPMHGWRKWPGAKRNSRGDAPAQPLSRLDRVELHCTAKSVLMRPYPRPPDRLIRVRRIR